MSEGGVWPSGAVIGQKFQNPFNVCSVRIICFQAEFYISVNTGNNLLDRDKNRQWIKAPKL
jgi:hypothetical protein